MLVMAIVLVLLATVVAVLLLAPAVIDLVNRDERPGLSFAVPFVLWPLPLLGAGALPALERTAYDRTLFAAFLWTGVHLALALFFVVLALGLAASRGLRPGGATQRRRRTTTLAFLLVLPTLGLPVVAPALAWMVLVPMIAWLWLIALNRRGPRRLERGKEWSASLLVAAAIQGAIAVVHMHFGSYLEPWSDLALPRWTGLPVGLVLVGLVGGLRYLAGAVPWGFPVVSLATGLSVLVPMTYWSTRESLPRDTVLPVAVDLMGSSGFTLAPVRRPDCFWIPGDEPDEPYPCSYHRYIVVPPDLPLDELALDGWIVVDDGQRAIGNAHGRWGEPVVVRSLDGRATIDGRFGSFSLGDELHAVLSDPAARDRPLVVVRTPDWTVQDYVALCLSTGPGHACELR